ncbi:DUF6470 family protein [Neobacillus citreus]|uniref:DUF6470 family protein n=1 Tax=Neobacillus citreus TaxID=2833578 RepID=A0A942Y684_9BACI|nr:DUF6470 family protein [Neobacillus citreus]MCH6263907.1 DUF6470 family protein [Neobacillus citreus]
MQVPQIRMHQTYAQIGLRIIQPRQEIQQKPADLLINQVPSSMTIDRKAASMEINQDQARNELGFKPISVLSTEMADFSKQEGLEAVAEIAEEGDQLAAIEKKADAIMWIASQNANPEPADFNIKFIPSYGAVKIHYIPTELHISWKQGGAEITSVANRPIHEYTPGRTEVYLRQHQQLDIDFIGGTINART